MILETSLLSTAYFPPIEYFAVIANSGLAKIEAMEMYQKQSYRTRCHINGANGLLVLTIPVLRSNNLSPEKANHKVLIKDVRIDYSKPWLIQHKRAIEAAYMSSPFFEYYMDDLFPILDSKEEFLFDLNLKLINKLNELLGISTKVEVADSNYILPGSAEFDTNNISDYRDLIHPKKPECFLEEYKLNKPYYQVFTNKQGFIKNLSIIDLLFNEGPNSISFLESKSL